MKEDRDGLVLAARRGPGSLRGSQAHRIIGSSQGDGQGMAQWVRPAGLRDLLVARSRRPSTRNFGTAGPPTGPRPGIAAAT
eukprot:291007-Hanusia_phi.AAC.1